MSLYDRAYKSAEHFGLEDEFVEGYQRSIKEGYSKEEAIFHALYEWDIILIIDEDGNKDADI